MDVTTSEEFQVKALQYQKMSLMLQVVGLALTGGIFYMWMKKR